MKKRAYHHTIFVYDLKGNYLFDGTFERPLKTIQVAVSFTHTLRIVHGSDKTLCISILGRTYYLGTNATTTSSQISAIALTSNDSNLVIENYQDEQVILSGGTLLNLQCTLFTNYQLGLGGGASVFNPSTNFWSTASPPQGNNYVVPRGLIVNNGALPHIGNWSKPTTGLVHAFHSGYWDSWMFEIASINSTQNTTIFSRGDFQEVRGSGNGGAFYVANIFEELDLSNEWFLDKDIRTLYFMPNESMPQIFLASQIPCLICISGNSIQDSIHNVLIQGLTLTQTSNIYMRDYMVPGGDDWTVHRGGNIYLTNTRNITITRNLFMEPGSNGVALIDYNDATSITLNEFVWLADSAIILVGSTNGIDGFSVVSQPANTLIKSNLIHETGIYVKQSSSILISVIGNLMFNIPRVAINVNDGFYGINTLSWNIIFNTVRETSDHRLINTWDRQPFLSDAVQRGLPSLWQHKSYIHHNTLVNNYNSFYPIDHDDGSCFYENSYNFQVVFWLYNLFLIYIEYNDIPSIDKYRIQ
ncbi:unnamed protein product [Rotaria sp. Silwood1]|nr:unnamed protein product [Rotaria sp. Silwood1]